KLNARVDGYIRINPATATNVHIRADDGTGANLSTFPNRYLLADYGSLFDADVVRNLCLWVDHCGGMRSTGRFRILQKSSGPCEGEARLIRNQQRLSVVTIYGELPGNHSRRVR